MKSEVNMGAACRK